MDILLGLMYKKSLKNVLNVVIKGFFAIILIWILCHIFLEDIIPHSRSWFWDYESFVENTERAVFPKKLPVSAQYMEYYVYEGWLEDKCGYSAMFSSEDYAQIKEERMAVYNAKENSNTYCYNGEVKQYLDLQQMKVRRIDFLDRILPKGDDGQFYFLGYRLYEGGEIYSYGGVLCRDETCEIIEFMYFGPIESRTNEYENHSSIWRRLSIGVICVVNITFFCTFVFNRKIEKGESG